MGGRFLGVAALLWIGACGFQGDGARDGDRAVLRRDSAGIEIVENSRPAWASEEQWQLSPEPLFVIRGYQGGPERGPLDPTSIDVDSRGRVIVGDGNQVGWDAILVYDSTGRFLFQAGGEGRGPGEFGQLWWASTYRQDSLLAFDMSGDKVSIFDSDGRFARKVDTPRLEYTPPPRGTYGYTAGMDAAYGDGHLLAYPFGAMDVSSGPGVTWVTHLVLRLSPDGESWDTLGNFGIYQQYWTGARQEPLYFGAIAVTAVGRDELYYGAGTAFEIARHDSLGRITRLIRRAHEARPVTPEWTAAFRTWYLDRAKSSPEASAQMLERITQRLETARYAEVLPPYSALFLDDQANLWVEEFRWLTPEDRSPLGGPGQWSVFDSTGVWLGNVQTPPGFILRKVAGDRAFGFAVDENDVKDVHVYGLDRRG